MRHAPNGFMFDTHKEYQRFMLDLTDWQRKNLHIEMVCYSTLYVTVLPKKHLQKPTNNFNGNTA